MALRRQELELPGGGPERTIVLKSEHRVTGRVTDAVTGRPIAAFSVIPVDVFRKDWFVAEPYNAKAGKDGRLDYLATRADIPIRLRVEAIGYRAQDGPGLPPRRRRCANARFPLATEPDPSRA